MSTNHSHDPTDKRHFYNSINVMSWLSLVNVLKNFGVICRVKCSKLICIIRPFRVDYVKVCGFFNFQFVKGANHRKVLVQILELITYDDLLSFLLQPGSFFLVERVLEFYSKSFLTLLELYVFRRTPQLVCF